jgi:hypothetical protein
MTRATNGFLGKLCFCYGVDLLNLRSPSSWLGRAAGNAEIDEMSSWHRGAYHTHYYALYAARITAFLAILLRSIP